MNGKIIVRNNLADFMAFARLVSLRRKKIAAAPAQRPPEDPVNAMVREMHPRMMRLRITKVEQETPSTRSFTLEPDMETTKKLATFRAGQYLNVKAKVGGNAVSRNYSLSSTPSEAAAGFYRITVREKEGGFVTRHIFGNWKVGTIIESSGPAGLFVYEGLRDKRQVIAITGGCGITPIYSMAKDACERDTGVSFTILYGIRDSRDIIFKAQLEELEKKSGGAIKVVYVASEPEADWKGLRGFITSDLIAKTAGKPEDRSYFICGPQAMYNFLDGEFAKLNIPRRLIRRELFGETDNPERLPGYPKENLDRVHRLKVYIADEVLEIEAAGKDTLMVAIEKAGLEPLSRCRSGECGWCRSRLLSGEVFISPMNDGRRIADKRFDWIHPCSTYPLSDLELRVTRSISGSAS